MEKVKNSISWGPSFANLKEQKKLATIYSQQENYRERPTIDELIGNFTVFCQKINSPQVQESWITSDIVLSNWPQTIGWVDLGLRILGN